MPGQPLVYTVGDFVRRVVASLLQREWRGRFLCSRCLVKLTRDNMDRSYSKADIALVMDGIFADPGAITLAPASACAHCTRKKVSCLGVPLSG